VLYRATSGGGSVETVGGSQSSPTVTL
jgi:hypothetical protein